MLRATPAWLIALAVAACGARDAAAGDIDFERQVAGVLARHCAACHNAFEPKGGLDLTSRPTALTGGESQLPAIAPGDPENSHLLRRVRDGEMPPPGKGQRLPAAELALLETWIRAGAIWPAGRILSPFELSSETRAGRDWWSLQRLRRPTVPVVAPGSRVRTPLDAFITEKLAQAGLAPAEEADRATFIRRASFDLLGLPPSPHEIEAFVNDAADDAYEKLIDRLLASPHYGERWARHWLDVVRFAESNGYETNTARNNAWPYRDWVIAALNDDLPYPQFILAQLAGDQLGVDAATGFLVGGAHDVVGSPDIELTLQQRMNDLDDMISTTSAAFLGLSVGCAKCHDHKFDPIAQRDYYCLQAIFAGVQHGERELRKPDSEKSRLELAELRDELAAVERKAQAAWVQIQPVASLGASPSSALRPAVNAQLNVDRFMPARARFVRFTILATNGGEPCLDEIEVFAVDGPQRNLALAGSGAKATASSVFAEGGSNLHQIEHLNDGRFGNSRSWIPSQTAGGWAQIELREPATIDRVVWARDREGGFRDRLATRYKIEISEAGDQWQLVAEGDDRKPWDSRANAPDPLSTEGLPPRIAEQVRRDRDEVTALRTKLSHLAPQKAYLGTFVKAEPTHVLYRGEPLQRRDQVAPGAIAAVHPSLALDPDAPEADRRVALAKWIGDESNPLTARVAVNRIWHYHFGQGLVKTPSDFGFHGGRPSHEELLDWLASEFVAQGWRPKALHRLMMLSSTYRQSSHDRPDAAEKDAAGRLLWRFTPRRLEAEAIRDAILWTSGALDARMGGEGFDVFEPNTNYVKVYTPKQAFGPTEWRRMVYQNKPRMRQDATFGEFDCPDSSQPAARRNVSTTALQALNLMNSSLVLQQADVFAERLKREAGTDRASQVRRAFWLALGRAPDDEELRAADRLIGEQGLPVFCRAIYNANEFLHVN